jgi:hypothetical protein
MQLPKLGGFKSLSFANTSYLEENGAAWTIIKSDLLSIYAWPSLFEN